jgi:hypothetical protein
MKFDRLSHLRSWIPREDARILEIGPFFNPIYPKSSGFNTETVDVYCRDELIFIAESKLKLSPELVSRIESVDFVWKGSLSETVNQNAEYDVICSSHNFEHQPNPLLFLLEVEKLLGPGGVCSFAIPIASRCFDLFRNLSTTKDFLVAFREKKIKPEWLDVYEAESIKVNPEGLDLHKHHKFDTSELHLEKNSYFGKLDQQQLLRESPNHYMDIHMSVLNPARFKLIMCELSNLGILSRLKIFAISERGHEFFVHLSNDKEPLADYNLDWEEIVKADLHYLRRELNSLCKSPNLLKSKYFFYG